MFSRQIFSENQKFFFKTRGSHEQQGGFEGCQKTHNRGNFLGDESRSKLSQSAKILKLIALHLNSTLTRPPIYKEAYTEKHETASPGNSVGVTELSLILSFVQLDKKVFGRMEKS